MFRYKKAKIVISFLAIISFVILFFSIVAKNQQKLGPLSNHSNSYAKTLTKSSISKNPSLPFDDGNLCLVENENLNCSRIFADSLLRNIVETQNANHSNIKSEVMRARSQVFFVELSSNQTIFINKLILPSISPEVTAYARRFLTNLYMPPYIKERDATNSNSPTFKNVKYESIMENLLNPNQSTKAYELKANIPLTFTIIGIGQLDKLRVSFNIISKNKLDNIKITTKVIPLIDNRISPTTPSYLPNNNDFTLTTTHSIQSLLPNTNKALNIDLLDLNTLKLSFLNPIVLNKNLEFSNSSFSFLKNMWEVLFKNKWNNGIVPLNKQIKTFKLSGDFRFAPKDFINFKNIENLSIFNSRYINASSISSDDWARFFTNNPALKKLQINFSSLNNLGFANIKTAIEKSSLHELSLDLANNDLTSIPTLTNSNIITELNLRGNALINIAALESGFSKLKKIDLSYNGSLINTIPSFLRSVNSLASLEYLVISGLNINESSLTLADLKNKLLLTSLKQKLIGLDLSDNGLKDISKLFANQNFERLANINLSNNNIKIIPNDFWLAFASGDKSINLSNNPNLTINIDVQTNVLSRVKSLNLLNTGTKTFGGPFKIANVALKELIVGSDSINDDYSFLVNMPSKIEKLTLTNIPNLSILSSQLKETFKKLTNLTQLKITDSNLTGSFLGVFESIPSLNILDLSRNSFTSLVDLKKANLPNLNALIINDNDWQTKNGLNINNLLWWALQSSSNIKKISLINTKLLISSISNPEVQITGDNNVIVQITEPNEITINHNSPLSNAALIVFLNNKISFAIINNANNLDTLTFIDPQIWLLNALKWDAMKQKKQLIAYYLESVSNKNDIQIPLSEYKDYSLPPASPDELTKKESFISYFNRSNQAKEEYSKQVRSYYSNLKTIKDLEGQQEKVKKDLDELKKENKKLLDTIKDLNSGTLFETAISLVSVVLAFNLIFAGILIYKNYKKRKK